MALPTRVHWSTRLGPAAAVVGTVVALAFGSLAAATRADAATPDRVCASPRSAHVLAARGSVSVVQSRRGYVIGCYRHRAAAVLTTTEGFDGVHRIGPFHIAGDWVAWDEIFRGKDDSAVVRACDLRQHRSVAAAPSDSAILPTVIDVGLTPSGGIAFTATDEDHRSSGQELIVLDANGRRQVASGNALDTRSLAVGRSGAYWMSGVSPSFAPLRGTAARPPSINDRSCGRPRRSTIV